MPKYDLIEKEIEWCEANRTNAKEYQDGFIAGLRHALFLMKSRTSYTHTEPVRVAHVTEMIRDVVADRI
jgi:hypothetical protein